MSDLTATNCGCTSDCSRNDSIFGGSGCNNIWIILLLLCCSGSNNGCGNGIFTNNDNNGCSCIIWILLLSCLCGNGNSCF